MTTTARVRLFTVVAAVVVGVALALALNRPERHDPSRSSDTPAAVHHAARPPARPPWGTEPPNPPAAAADRAAAANVAGRFTRALIALQHHDQRRQARPAVAQTTTAKVGRSLLDQPLRGRPPAAPRIGPVAVYGPFDGQIKTSVTLRYPAGKRTLLELEQRPHRNGWLVTHIRP